jgi:membrane protein YqaA with SNARE-associated domain
MNRIATAFKQFFARVRRNVGVTVFVLGVLAVSLFFYAVSPETLIGYVGIENAYALMGAVAFIGGVSIFNGVPYPLMLASFAAGGLNPWILGIVSGTAVILGDTVSYYVGARGKDITSPKLQKYVDTITRSVDRHPRLASFFFFIYGAVSPFPNDVITIPMGLKGYPFWKVMVPLGIGNVVFSTSIALLAAYSYQTMALFGSL